MRVQSLDKGMKDVPIQGAGAGIEPLDGIEHIQVTIEAILQALGQGYRLPLEEEFQPHLLLGARIREHDESECQRAHQRQRD